jgi:hypothetical protein
MPRVKKRTKLRRDLTDHHVTQLLTGFDFFGDAFGKGKPNLEDMRDAWDSLRDELLPKFIAENPGERPFAWWKFDAPEPRRQLIHRYSDESKAKVLEHSGAEDLRLLLAAYDNKPEPEPELDYLKRNGLLTPTELAHDN